MKKITQQRPIDTKRYSVYDNHMETFLTEEEQRKQFNQVKELELIKPNYKSFVNIDLDRLYFFVQKKTSPALLGFFFKLVAFAEMTTNRLIKKDGSPHGAKSIAGELGITQQHAKLSLDNLVEANLIELHQSHNKKGAKKYYYLNYFLVRRGSMLSSVLLLLFNDPLPKVLDKDWSKEPNLK